MNRLATSLAFAAVLIAARPAAAQSAGAGTGTDPVAAAALFQEGREAAKKGDYATACPKLSDSYRLDPAVGTLLNLADCEEHLGKIASAWQLFQQAAEHLASSDSRTPVARGRVAALEARLPRLMIVLAPNAPAGTRVLRDGAQLGGGSLGTALPIDPGEHTVKVIAADHEDRSFTVITIEGKAERLVVEIGRAIAAPAAPPPIAPVAAPPPAEFRVGTARKIGIAIAAVGVVGIGVAIGTGLALPGKKAIVDAHCDANDRCDAQGIAAARSGQTLSGVNTAMWFVGGIVTGVGAAVFIFGGNGDSGARTALSVTQVAGGGVASLGGTF